MSIYTLLLASLNTGKIIHNNINNWFIYNQNLLENVFSNVYSGLIIFLLSFILIGLLTHSTSPMNGIQFIPVVRFCPTKFLTKHLMAMFVPTYIDIQINIMPVPSCYASELCKKVPVNDVMHPRDQSQIMKNVAQGTWTCCVKQELYTWC